MKSLPILCALCVFVVNLPASGPPWWATQNVLSANATADDYAVVNQGQLKNIASKAAAEMNLQWASQGGAGALINNMVGAWQTPTNNTDDFAVVNLGQLKTVAAPFYDRLVDLWLAGSRPWENSLSHQAWRAGFYCQAV